MREKQQKESVSKRNRLNLNCEYVLTWDVKQVLADNIFQILSPPPLLSGGDNI